MKAVFQIFFGDLRRLSRNWVAMIVVAGVCFIPALYAWFNIDANMDPYSNTRGIRIGVASLDQGTESQITGRINAGDEIIENLKKNHDLGWEFVSAEQAVDGVKAGTYYAAIVIPQDFSSSLLSVLSGDVKQSKIEYYLNEKKNAIAPKVTDTGASTIQKQINDTFVSVASGAISQMVESSSLNLSGDLAGLGKDMTASLDKVKKNLQKQKEMLDTFEGISEESKDLINEAKDTMKDVKSAASKGAEALEETEQTLQETRERLSALSAAVNGALNQADQALSDIRRQLSVYVGDLNSKIHGADQEMQLVLNLMDQLITENEKIISTLKEISEKLPGKILDALVNDLEAENSHYRGILTSLRKGAGSITGAGDTLASLYKEVSDLLEENQKNISAERNQFSQTVLPSFDQILDSLASQSGRLSGLISGIGPAADQISAVLSGLKNTLVQGEEALSGTEDFLNTASEKLDQIETDFHALKSTAAYEKYLTLLKDDPADIADFMSSPVRVKTKAFYAVENYGSAMAPFYTNLAIWVSGIVLIAIFKLEVDRKRKINHFTVTQAYFGRWLLFIAIGLIQALIVCAGDLWLLGIQCENPGAFFAAGLFASFVYINLIYALSITFKHIGKAISVILVILQIPGSAGTYPIEMTPGFFQHIHPLLPFTYGINAMREAVGGIYADHYIKDLLCLSVFLPLAFFIGLVIRPRLLNLNRMFDKKLQRTGLMICEEDGMTNEKVSMNTVIRILAGQEAFRSDMIAKAEKFEKSYEKRKKRGFMLILILPLIFLILMFSISSKMVFLVLWITSIIVIAGYLIFLEYIHESLHRKLRFAEKSQEELLASVKNGKTEKGAE